MRTELFVGLRPAARRRSVAAAKDTEHGLSAYVHPGDLARGLAVADRLEGAWVMPRRAVGGGKQSGRGRKGGRDGLLEYPEPKYFAVSW